MTILALVYRPARILCAFCALCLLCMPLSADEKRIGAFLSPKGLGIAMQFDNYWGDEIYDLKLYADMYGVYSGRTTEPGIVLSYTHNYVLHIHEFDYSTFSLYAGAGFLGGYVHDFERGLLSVNDSSLRKGMGIVAALSCNIGISFDFDRNVTIDLSMTLNPGVHLTRDTDSGSVIVSAYNRGYIMALYPQLSIYYRF